MKQIGERRGKSAREKVFMRGTLEMPNHKIIDCVVTDLSETGARITVAETPPTINSRVRLTVPIRNVLKDCLVVHLGSDNTLGLTFIPVQRR